MSSISTLVSSFHLHQSYRTGDNRDETTNAETLSTVNELVNHCFKAVAHDGISQLRKLGSSHTKSRSTR
jgi:hypothetical protein